MSSVGSPTEVSTISIVMRPALGILAAPILAHVAVKLKQKKTLKQILMKPTLYKIPIWNMIQIIFWKIYNAFLNNKKEIGYSKKKQQLFSFFEKYEQKLVLLTLMDLIHYILISCIFSFSSNSVCYYQPNQISTFS